MQVGRGPSAETSFSALDSLLDVFIELLLYAEIWEDSVMIKTNVVSVHKPGLQWENREWRGLGPGRWFRWNKRRT
jgi:hypothetical protein